MLPLLVGLFLRDLAHLDGSHPDEVMWVPYSSAVFTLFVVDADVRSPFWQNDFYTYGAYNPPLGKYLIGLGTYAAGHRAIAYPRYDWQRSVAWNIAQGRFLRPEVLAAARLPVALLGIFGCAMLFWAVALVSDLWHASLAVCVLVASQLFLKISRLALLDAPGVAFALLALVCLWYLVDALRAERRAASLGWAAACGVACGLALGTKLTGGLIVLTCLLVLALEWCVALLRHRGAVWHAPCGLIVCALAVAVFIGCNPFLYPDPVAGISHMLGLPALMSRTPGALAPGDMAGKLAAVGQQLLHFAPLSQLGLPGDALFLLLGLARIGHDLWRRPWGFWQRQGSTLLVWGIVTFVGITVWIPMPWDRYTLPLQPWSAAVYAYGLLWLGHMLFRSLVFKRSAYAVAAKNPFSPSAERNHDQSLFPFLAQLRQKRKQQKK